MQNYTYSPFGTCLNVSNDPINNLQFIGRYGGYLDNDTGLTYFWHRWYDSRDGRWISRDPIGACGGSNIYEYAKNRPTTIIDYSGLIGTYGQWCGGGWSGGTVYGTPDFNGPYDDDLDLCCRGHDKDWYDCDKEEEKREKESKCKNKPNKPKGETKEQCKQKANKKFCNCLRGVQLTWDLYKFAYLIGAKKIFGCK